MLRRILLLLAGVTTIPALLLDIPRLVMVPPTASVISGATVMSRAASAAPQPMFSMTRSLPPSSRSSIASRAMGETSSPATTAPSAPMAMASEGGAFLRRRAAERALARKQEMLPPAVAAPATGSGTEAVMTGFTVDTLMALLEAGKEGQALMTGAHGPTWTTLPRQGGGTGGGGGGQSPARRGGGGAPQNSNDDGQVERHDHTSDANGGVLDINAATKGVLRQEKGGTGFGSYATGDLLVGTAGGTLEKRAVGIAGEVLAVSGATVGWKSVAAVAQGGTDARYVNTSGDTMTGQLVINLASGTLGLKVLQAMSGASIHADRSLDSSGTLVVGGNARFKSTMTIGGITYAFPGADGSSSGKVLATDGAGHLSWTQGTQWTTNGTNITYNGGSVGIGTSAPKATLDVGGTISGSLVYLGPGTASTPALAFNGDTNTGLYWIGADTLGFATGGAERVRINSSGNVGIGTTSPANKLDVDGAAAFGTYAGTAVSCNCLVVSNGIGIGTTNPSTYLEVRGTHVANKGLLYVNANSGEKGYIFTNADTAQETGLAFQAAGTSKWFMYRPASSNDLRLSDATTDRMTFQQGGNVGIGKTSPVTKLDVLGTISGSTITVMNSLGVGTTSPAAGYVLDARGNIRLGAGSDTASNRSSLYINAGGYSNPSASANANGDKLVLYEGSGYRDVIGMDASARMWFQSRATTSGGFGWWTGSNPDQIMVLQGDGSLGIGKTSPSTKLDVVGTISGAALVINRGGATVYGNITSPGAGLNSEKFGIGASVSTGNNNTAIGYFASAGGAQATAVGASANAGGNPSLAVGYNASAGGANSVAIGPNTSGAGTNITAVGYAATTSGNFGTAIGSSAATTGASGIAIGYIASAAANQLVIGSSSGPITSASIGVNTNSTPLIFVNTTGMGLGKTSPGAKLDVVGTISGSTVLGSNGLTTKVIAGACSDSNVQNTDGTLCIDSTDGRVYFRYGGAWHYAAQTAGFQIPKMVRNGKDETEGLAVGDAVIGRLDERMEDGALHGVWEKLDLRSEVARTLLEHPELLDGSGTGASDHVSLDDIRDLTVKGALTVYGDAMFLGDVAVRGSLTLSANQAGTATILAGQTEIHVEYAHAFATVPVVSATPEGVPFALWGVTDKSDQGFTLRLASPGTEPVRFDWLAVPVSGGNPALTDSTPATTSDTPPPTGSGSAASAAPSSAAPIPPTASGAVAVPSDTEPASASSSPADAPASADSSVTAPQDTPPAPADPSPATDTRLPGLVPPSDAG